MPRKINVEKVIRERIKPLLTPVEREALKRALKAVKSVCLICLLLLGLANTTHAGAECKGSVLNPITDVCWECMFPARIGVIEFGRGSDTVPGGEIGSPVCACVSSGTATLGLKVAFWEHAYLVETVKNPWCMPALGSGLDVGISELQAGVNRSQSTTDGDSSYSSQQVHWYTFPVWTLLDMFWDFPCISSFEFDLAYPTEVDPTWQDDLLSFILNPEALLFGNPVTQLSCMADSVAASVGAPIDPLFWCQGSWGGSYPLNGSSNTTNPNHLNAQMAGRMIYKLSREGLLWDTAMDKKGCSIMGTLAPIWNKSHYRLQPMRPRKKNECLPIGRSDFLWGSALNPPLGTDKNSPDNYLWSLTRGRICCVGYSQGSSTSN